jgi:hypothetical protein
LKSVDFRTSPLLPIPFFLLLPPICYHPESFRADNPPFFFFSFHSFTRYLSGKGGHAHIQIVPVPSSLTTDAIAAAFTTLGDSTGISFATGDAADAALNRARGSAEGNYFRVDLPNGGGKMVHLMERGGRFDLQFGR